MGIWEEKRKVKGVAGRQFKSSLDTPVLDAMQHGSLRSQYRGVRMLKDPLDLGLYLQLFSRAKIQSVIEIGTKFGGSALFFADMLQSHGASGQVISIDIENLVKYSDPRIKFLQGDAHELWTVLPNSLLNSLPRPWLVIEDSSHMFDTTLGVLNFFDQHLQSEDYIVVEDGILSQLTIKNGILYEDGPNAALTSFLDARPESYEIDTALCDLYGYNATFNPNGWLRRK